jgi:hypothetical protein
MSVSTTIPATVEIRRSRLLALVGGVAVVAAAITGALTAYAVDTGQPAVPVPRAVVSSPNRSNLSWLTPQERSYLQQMTPVCAVLMCQPDEWVGPHLDFRIRR